MYLQVLSFFISVSVIYLPIGGEWWAWAGIRSDLMLLEAFSANGSTAFIWNCAAIG